MAEDSESNQQKSIYDVPMDLPGDKPPKNLRPPKKFVYAVLGIAVLAGLVFAGWELFGSKNNNQGPIAQPTAEPQQAVNTNNDVPQATNTKSYESDTIGIKLNHPDTWKVTESGGGVRLTSPNFTYQAVDGTEIDGHFRIYIRLGARSVDGKYIGRGVAIKPSEKLKYSDPLPGQRETTLLSSFGLDKTDNFGFFLIAGNFDLKKGDTLGPDYGKEADAFIVSGGYSSYELKDDMATSMMPAESYDQTNAYKQAVGIVQSLQLR